MNASDLSRVIETVGKDRGIKKEVIISALEQAMLAAAQKKYGPNAQLEAHYNDETGEIDVYLFKKVVESDDAMLEESEEIKIEDAHELDPDAQIGDELGVKVETDFGRIDAQTAKQVIFQRVRDAEREIVFKDYIHRKGEIITGIARRIERGNLVIDLGKTDALLPRNEIIPGEQFRPGDRVQAFLRDVVNTNRGPQLYLSRTCPEYLMKLFEIEVPEIRDEVVEIKACAREAGARSKIAVISKDRDVDPVGACVGMKGVRVQAIIAELKGEKIDIIPWSENSIVYVRSALAPAEISSVNLDEVNRTMEIMVEDDQLSLAIGRKGQNVRLAAQLTGWRLDIISKTKLQKRTTDAIFNLQHIEGVTETLAQAIFQSGFQSVRQVAEAELEDLQKIPGYDAPEDSEKLRQRANEVIEKSGDLLATPGDAEESQSGTFTAQPKAPAATPTSSQSSSSSHTGAAGSGPSAGSGDGSAKSQAEERLRQMFAEQKQEQGDSSEANETASSESESTES